MRNETFYHVALPNLAVNLGTNAHGVRDTFMLRFVAERHYQTGVILKWTHNPDYAQIFSKVGAQAVALELGGMAIRSTHKPLSGLSNLVVVRS